MRPNNKAKKPKPIANSSPVPSRSEESSGNISSDSSGDDFTYLSMLCKKKNELNKLKPATPSTKRVDKSKIFHFQFADMKVSIVMQYMESFPPST